MLCRVAESLFWMSRYIERAENTVRLVDVTLQTLLESEHGSEEISYSHWKPILTSLGDLELFETQHPAKSSYDVTSFLTFSTQNPSSVFSCISFARENARMIRDQISSEMWETINRMYLFLKKTNAEKVCSELNFEFFHEIKEFSLLFQGITEATFPHQIGYEFIICGRQIERADKTCRILDSKRHMRSGPDAENEALNTAQLAALLRGCSAFEAYHRIYVSAVTGDHVRSMLILSRTFPRSVLFCVNRLQLAMHAISKCSIAQYSNEAERKMGLLISRLNYANEMNLQGDKAHRLIHDIEDALAEIAIELSNRYMLTEIVDPVADLVEA
jgi:uncharacterized alpha-E superfamily protein